MRPPSLQAATLLVALLSGCAAAPPPIPEAPADPEEDPAGHPGGAAFTQYGQPRDVGDFSVHRFSGSFREKPLVLTERVVGRSEDALMVEFTFEEEEGVAEVLRVRMEGGTLGRVSNVWRVEGDREIPVGVHVYDTLMSRLAFFPDDAEAGSDTEALTCLVGEQAHGCTRTSYRVTVGGRPAELSIVTADALGGREVEGEVVTSEGDVVYRTRLLETGNDAPTDRAASLVGR